MQTKNEKRAFSVVRRMKSFRHAFRGIYVLIKTEHNAWLHIFSALAVIVLGFYFQINEMQWIATIFAIGLVVTAEAFNTAIEFDMDLTSPEFHPFAKDTKDVSAGA